MRRPPPGFTLVELMTVVAVIGILVAIAVPNLRSTADGEASARNLAGIIAEAARVGVTRGPLPAELGSDRMKVVISTSAPHRVRVELQHEDVNIATGTNWWMLSETVLTRGITIAGVTDTAELGLGSGSGSGSGAGSGSGYGSATGSGYGGSGTSWDITCSSTGQCQTKTIYLQGTSAQDRWRVIVLPLSSSPQVMRGW